MCSSDLVGISTVSTGRRFFLVAAFLAKAGRKENVGGIHSSTATSTEQGKGQGKATIDCIARYWKEFNDSFGNCASSCIRKAQAVSLVFEHIIYSAHSSILQFFGKPKIYQP